MMKKQFNQKMPIKFWGSKVLKDRNFILRIIIKIEMEGKAPIRNCYLLIIGNCVSPELCSLFKGDMSTSLFAGKRSDHTEWDFCRTVMQLFRKIFGYLWLIFNHFNQLLKANFYIRFRWLNLMNRFSKMNTLFQLFLFYRQNQTD